MFIIIYNIYYILYNIVIGKRRNPRTIHVSLLKECFPSLCEAWALTPVMSKKQLWGHIYVLSNLGGRDKKIRSSRPCSAKERVQGHGRGDEKLNKTNINVEEMFK